MIAHMETFLSLCSGNDPATGGAVLDAMVIALTATHPFASKGLGVVGG
jgi:hypothetical protein